MKQAIRELLRSRMEVCDETPDIFTRCRWFTGYASEFDAVELGQWPPEYEAIFTLTRNGHPGRELMFRRRRGNSPTRGCCWMFRLSS
jgi:hypothetical protein